MSVMLVSVISGPAQSLTSTSSSSVLLEMLFILLGHTETTDEGGGGVAAWQHESCDVMSKMMLHASAPTTWRSDTGS